MLFVAGSSVSTGGTSAQACIACASCATQRTPPDMSSGEAGARVTLSAGYFSQELEDIGELEERYPYDVYLYMYDITDGWACRYSPLFCLANAFEPCIIPGLWCDVSMAIWSTGSVVASRQSQRGAHLMVSRWTKGFRPPPLSRTPMTLPSTTAIPSLRRC
ncbi:desi1, partial [Symbiodinium necroappetens]